jgi:hypothetical protein
MLEQEDAELAKIVETSSNPLVDGITRRRQARKRA